MASRYSVHRGPKGGMEFREWTGEVSFRTVSRYVAWPHLSADDRTWVETETAANRAKKSAARANDAAWAHIMRGAR